MKFLKTKAAMVGMSDLMTATTKVIERLDALEKKMDLVLNQTSVRPSGGYQYPKLATPQLVSSSAPRQSNLPQRPNEVKPAQEQAHVQSQSHAQGPSHGRSHERRERVLHKAVCAECQKDCEIPFKPTGERPVYCKACFSKRKGSDPLKRNNENPQGPKLLPTSASVPATAPAPVILPRRQVSVTKKGVGKVTVSEIVHASSRDISHKEKSHKPVKKKR